MLERFPRVELAHTPTPLEPLPNLARELGGARLFVKRDDCTGLAMGGNKARQLEFYFGEALAQGCDTVVGTGATQSNFVRMMAAAACKLGMRCHIQLESRVPGMPQEYYTSGNVLLDQLFGAHLHFYPEGEDEGGADRRLREIAEAARKEGALPYVISITADHPPIGALGYVDAATELLRQAEGLNLQIDAVVLASGGAFTHVGMLAGLRALGSRARVAGICVRRSAEAQKARVGDMASRLGEMLGRPDLIEPADIWIEDAYLGSGYGRVNAGTLEAIHLAAEREGLVLDPVYTGKSFAGLIGLLRQGAFRADDNIVFLHSGGAPALFGYNQVLFGAEPARD
jgi:D-cysteine desulfhydrase/L-cysteate sulfo-lyase